MNRVDIAHLQEWVGRTETNSDTLHASHARRVAALLDLATAPGEGDPLPPLWHWFYFAPTTAQSCLGRDGHPERTGFMPPISLPRRMWAAGRLVFQRPLRVGDTVTRESVIASITEKTGRKGALVFLSLKHRLFDKAGLAIEEQQDIVYLDHSKTRQPAPASDGRAPGADWRDPFDPDPVKLFRYSALTFNAHRIHYDLPYATQEEGYPGLVVQGPLTATLLMDRYLKHCGKDPRSFSFRGRAPLFSGGEVSLCGRGRDDCAHDLWAEGPGGYTAMAASVSIERGS